MAGLVGAPSAPMDREPGARTRNVAADHGQGHGVMPSSRGAGGTIPRSGRAALHRPRRQSVQPRSVEGLPGTAKGGFDEDRGGRPNEPLDEEPTPLEMLRLIVGRHEDEIEDAEMIAHPGEGGVGVAGHELDLRKRGKPPMGLLEGHPGRVGGSPALEAVDADILDRRAGRGRTHQRQHPFGPGERPQPDFEDPLRRRAEEMLPDRPLPCRAREAG